MHKKLILMPLSADTDLTVISLGLVGAFRNQGISSCYFNPIKLKYTQEERTNSLFISQNHAMKLLKHGTTDELLEEVVALYEHIEGTCDITVIEGLHYSPHKPYISTLNREMALALDADIILVASSYGENWPEHIAEDLLTTKAMFENDGYTKVIGTILHGPNLSATVLKRLEAATYIPIAKATIKSRRNKVNHVKESFDPTWIKTISKTSHQKHLSAAKFRYQLIQNARSLHKCIVLPESTDPRILKAATACAKRNIAECILLGDPTKIKAAAEKYSIELHSEVEIVESKAIRNNYLELLLELRKKKGLTKSMAGKMLQDDYILALLMLKANKVDGVVAGATHTTAHIISNALRIIKPAPNIKLVSSAFFMCVAQQVLVYADSALNINPSAEELAEIALTSAQTAQQFGIAPKVAMISYSTYESGTGESVDKVHTATKLAKKRWPNLIIDGPLQYDTARIPTVAAKKSPDGPLHGEATVCIFPNLDAGNTIYKAIQRAANIATVGPMLQGLSQPVNDLSRGCMVRDIIFSIALTAIQASSCII